MTLRLLNAYTSMNLGDAAIYQALGQLAQPAPVACSLAGRDLRHAPLLAPDPQDAAPRAWASVGGDVFNNARPALFTRRFARGVRELWSAPPRHTFLFGQSLPPSCRGIGFQALVHVLRRLSSVTVRDAASQARLSAAGVPCALSWDFAFALQVGPGAAAAGSALFAAAGVEPGRAVLASLRSFPAMYAQDDASFLAALATVLQRLRARGHQPAVLLQSDADAADTDYPAAAALRRMLPWLPVLDPFALAQTQPHAALDAVCGALAAARNVLAVRYHTAVLRLLAGRPAVCLPYSNKGDDLALRLHLPAFPLHGFDPAQVVAALERSADAALDCGAAAADVRGRFASALDLAVAGRPAAAREFAVS